MVLYQGFRSRRVPLASWWSVSLCFFASPFYLSCHIYRVSQLERVIFYRVSLLERVIADRVSHLEKVVADFRSRRVPLAFWWWISLLFICHVRVSQLESVMSYRLSQYALNFCLFSPLALKLSLRGHQMTIFSFQKRSLSEEIIIWVKNSSFWTKKSCHRMKFEWQLESKRSKARRTKPKIMHLEKVIGDRVSQLEWLIADRMSQLETVIAERVSQLEMVRAGFS